MKITLIGAGSLYLSRKVLINLLTVDFGSFCEICLMGPHIEPIRLYQVFLNRLIEKGRLNFSVSCTADLEEALKNADFVISLFAIGGMKCLEQDYKIPLEFHIDQCIGDSLGPGGIFRSQRVLPVFTDLIERMKRLCPDAWLLSFVNPIAVTAMAASRLGFERYIGLCGGVEATKSFIAHVLQEPVEALEFTFAGINHLSFALSITKNGMDQYPLFKQKLNDPRYLCEEKIRFDVMQHFGYFPAESSGHISDFLPWYRKNALSRERYCNVSGFHGASGAYYKFSKFISKYLNDEKLIEYYFNTPLKRSNDYCANIIEAICHKRDYSFYGNVSNRGYIDNLPENAAVEIPIDIDGGIVKPKVCGPLPPQLSALFKTNIIVQELCIEAFFMQNPRLIVAALSLDPLTSSVLTPGDCHRLAEKMLKKQAAYLPHFKDKPLYSCQEIQADYNVKPMNVQKEFDLAELVKVKRAIRQKKKKSNPER